MPSAFRDADTDAVVCHLPGLSVAAILVAVLVLDANFDASPAAIVIEIAPAVAKRLYSAQAALYFLVSESDTGVSENLRVQWQLAAGRARYLPGRAMYRKMLPTKSVGAAICR
jgi:hypothetical protein